MNTEQPPPNYVPCSQCGQIFRGHVGACGYSSCREHPGWPEGSDYLPDGATYCATADNPKGKPEYPKR